MWNCEISIISYYCLIFFLNVFFSFFLNISKVSIFVSFKIFLIIICVFLNLINVMIG